MSADALGDARDLIKICGLRRPADAVAAVESGADLLGFVFAPSKRRVTPGEAAACVRAARSAAPGRILVVGVFVDASLEEMTEASETADLDLIQLHGDEVGDFVGKLPRPVIRAHRPAPGSSPASLLRAIRAQRAAGRPPAAWLIDGFDPTSFGGTGVRADWDLARQVAGEVPTMLAGGLTAENVGEAIRQVGPLGVDVSSGVETDSVKDPAKIAAFVRAARGGFAARSGVGQVG
jgi:phosphoribosylanthranilate isomerase